MSDVQTTALPNKVGTAQIANPELKTVVMLFMQNFTSLDKRVAALEGAVRDVQRKGK